MSTIINMLRDNVQASPQKEIFRFWENGEINETVTFAELEIRSRAVALHLQHISHPGDRIVLLYPFGGRIIHAFFGCLAASRIAVPVMLPAMLPKERQMEMLKLTLQDAQSSLVMTTRSLYADLQPAIAAAGIPSTVRWLTAEEITASDQDAWLESTAGDDDVALLLYTSGSTRLPRGVALTQGNMLAFMRIWSEPFKDRQDDLDVTWAPLQHGAGLARVLLVLGHDRRLIFIAPMTFIQSPVTWLRLISQYRATIIGGSNFGYQTCVDRVTPAEREGLDLGSIHQVTSGGEPVRMETIRRFMETYAPYGLTPNSFQTTYGLSECTVLGTMSTIRGLPATLWVDIRQLEHLLVQEVPAGDPNGRQYVSSGSVQPGHDLRIVAPETRLQCPPDSIGEIWLAGPGVARGYWNKPEETEEVFHGYLENGEGPFLRTGDLGFLKDGELYVTGRIKDVIIVRGRNLYAVDFEMTVAGAHPALLPGSAAAFGVSVDEEEKVVLMHEIRPGQENVDVDEVARLVRQAVAERLDVPLHAVVLVKTGSLPRTGSGKIQRYLCRSRYLASLADQQK